MCEWCSGWCTAHCTKYTKRCKMVQLVQPVRAKNCRLETCKSLRTCIGLRVHGMHSVTARMTISACAALMALPQARNRPTREAAP